MSRSWATWALANVEGYGFEDALAAFEQQADRANNLSAAFDVVADDFAALVERSFETEGKALGSRWKRQGKVWAQAKADAGRGSDLLRLDGANGGRLLQSLIGEGKGKSWHVRRVTDDGLIMGTKLGIAGILLKGGTVRTKRGREVTIPARPYVRVRRADRERWLGYVGDHLAGRRPSVRRVAGI